MSTIVPYLSLSGDGTTAERLITDEAYIDYYRYLSRLFVADLIADLSSDCFLHLGFSLFLSLFFLPAIRSIDICICLYVYYITLV